MRLLRFGIDIAVEASWQLIADEGWAIASHIALSILMALFPFLILVTALAAFVGSKELADAAAQILLDAWPAEVAAPIAGELHSVVASSRGGVITFGVVFAIYFSSSGIESLRIGLNRAYGVTETRSWWVLRLESIAYVLVGALALLALAFLVVLGPLIFSVLAQRIPSLVLVLALVLVHLWLPAGRRRIGEAAPGVIATLALWLATGDAFGRYLAEFAYTYSITYAGLASAMIALVFLYWTALIFIYGGELNAAIMRRSAISDQ